jgi:hypothetical protein
MKPGTQVLWCGIVLAMAMVECGLMPLTGVVFVFCVYTMPTMVRGF